VNEALANVAVHQGCGPQIADSILATYGQVKRERDETIVAAIARMKPKKYPRIVSKCKIVMERADAEARKAESNKTALADYASIGKQIQSVATKITREDDAAVDAYNKHVGESNTFRVELVELLKKGEAAAVAAGKTIKEMKAEFIGDRLGDTQFKQLLRVARGKITFAEIRFIEMDKKRMQRALAKPAESSPTVQPSDKPAKITAPDGSSVKLDDLGPKAQEQIRATGNEGHVSTERRAEEFERIAQAEETPEEKSDRLLVEWKRSTSAAFNGMSPDDVKKARTWFNSQRWGVVPSNKKAA